RLDDARAGGPVPLLAPTSAHPRLRLRDAPGSGGHPDGPVPLVEIMSGSRLTAERDLVIHDVAQVVLGLGCWLIFLWPVVVSVTLSKCSPSWQLPPTGPAPPGSLPWLALAALAVWPFVLPYTQPSQQRRREVEKLFAKGHIGAALETMSRHAP